MSTRPAKPALSFWQIWNMCFGFLGIQFGFALQNANVSRIFQTLGADMEQIPILWIAAPLTGLIVQPIIGYLSDRTWTGLGRRRPYFLAGAVLASLALFAFPHAPALWIAAGLLWILDASINVSMEPFRAFVGDQLPPRQRSTGYAMQSFFIGIGSVVASMLPFLLEKAGVANTAPEGAIPDTVRYAFYIGGVVLLGAIAWTVFSTREYSPQELAGFADADGGAQPARRHAGVASTPRASVQRALPWLLVGSAAAALIWQFGLDKQLYILAAMLGAYGVAIMLSLATRRDGMLATLVADMQAMPALMRRLAVVQFFSWFALFAMWIYTTGAVTSVYYATTDTGSVAYNQGANWVGVLFAAYNGFAALAAVVIPLMVRLLGLRVAHLLNLLLGAAALASLPHWTGSNWLLVPMVGVGFAWASILSLPYAMLADSLPAEKMGVYMGIFNFFIVIPQLVAVALLGFLLKRFFHGLPMAAMLIGAASMALSGLLALWVRLPQQPDEDQ